MKSITFIFNKAPYGNNSGRELLDICLMASAFDMPITVIFQGEGIYQIMDQQQPELLKLKNHSLTFKALELYGIEKVLCDSGSLEAFGITEKQLLPVATLVVPQTITEQITNSDFVLML